METQDILNSKAVKEFIKGSLLLVGLFIVLSFGLAALVLLFGANLDCWQLWFIGGLVISPLVFLCGFCCLMRRCYVRLYGITSEKPEKKRQNDGETKSQTATDMKPSSNGAAASAENSTAT